MIDDHKLKLQTRRIIMPSSHLQFKFQLNKNMNKIERSKVKDHLLIFKMTIQIFSLHYDFHFDYHDNSI